MLELICDWSELFDLIDESTHLFIKRLARNDASWADGRSNQAGVYIPQPVLKAFFPRLFRTPDAKALVADLVAYWPRTGDIIESNIRHYESKNESHLTRLPREEFSELTPASLLFAGRFKHPKDGATHWFITIDSSSPDCGLVEAAVDLAALEHYKLLPSESFQASFLDDSERLIADLRRAIAENRLQAFISESASMPAPTVIAKEARARYLSERKLKALDPYEISRPGDAIMEISRDIEFSIYRKYELRHRASEVVSALRRRDDLIAAVVKEFPSLDRIFLSAGQRRKSRAGQSFELHIAALLEKFNFEEQASSGSRRLDFVFPSTAAFRADPNSVVILSAKTTLRERWKQVLSERNSSELFLATVDDRISSDALDEMRRNSITLVVPESLKGDRKSYYARAGNVISFRSFFDNPKIKSFSAA